MILYIEGMIVEPHEFPYELTAEEEAAWPGLSDHKRGEFIRELIWDADVHERMIQDETYWVDE